MRTFVMISSSSPRLPSARDIGASLLPLKEFKKSPSETGRVERVSDLGSLGSLGIKYLTRGSEVQ